MKYPLLAVLCLSSCASGALDKQAEYINNSHDKALVPPQARYIADDFIGGAYKEREKEFCGSDMKGCKERLRGVLSQRWQETYNGVSLQAFMDHCVAYPADAACKDLRLFEGRLRSAHNEAVEQSRAAQLARVQEARIAEADRRDRAISAAIIGGGAGVRQAPQAAPGWRSCTATTFGNTTQMNCY